MLRAALTSLAQVIEHVWQCLISLDAEGSEFIESCCLINEAISLPHWLQHLLVLYSFSTFTKYFFDKRCRIMLLLVTVAPCLIPLPNTRAPPKEMTVDLLVVSFKLNVVSILLTSLSINFFLAMYLSNLCKQISYFLLQIEFTYFCFV